KASLFPNLEKQLVGRDEEWILLQHSAHYDHGMGPHDVHGHSRTESGEVIRTDDRIVVLGEHVVDPGLVLEQILDAHFVEERPFHVRHDPREPVARRRVRLEDLLYLMEHRVLLETIVAEVNLVPGPHLELATL